MHVSEYLNLTPIFSGITFRSTYYSNCFPFILMSGKEQDRMATHILKRIHNQLLLGIPKRRHCRF